MNTNRRPDRCIHVEDLIGATVCDASGQSIGRVVDLEVMPKREWEIVGLIMGRFAFLDRFDTLRSIPSRLHGFDRELVVAWSDVDRFEDRRLTLRKGAKPGAGGRPSGDGGGSRH